jgi:hypothetical protein
MSAKLLYEQLIANTTWNTKKVLKEKMAAKRRNAAFKTGILVGLRPQKMLKPLDARQFDQQFELDAAMWYGAIMAGSKPFAKTILRLFTIFYRAGVIYMTSDGWADWSSNPFGNLASLLSHGQRVLVQIPDLGHGGGAIWDWLNTDDEIPKRNYATHGLSHRDPPIDLILGHRLHLSEEQGYWQSWKGHLFDRHYAFNPALGGEGNRNPFSATNNDNEFTFKKIEANGQNGHVYIHYRAPGNAEVGGLLVGCENAEHGKGKNPHTKAGHGLGGSQKVSVCGGHKWSKLKCGPKDEYNGFICDLTDRGNDLNWLTQTPLIDPDILDGKTAPVIPCGRIAPVLLQGLAARRRALAGEE